MSATPEPGVQQQLTTLDAWRATLKASSGRKSHADIGLDRVFDALDTLPEFKNARPDCDLADSKQMDLDVANPQATLPLSLMSEVPMLPDIAELEGAASADSLSAAEHQFVRAKLEEAEYSRVCGYYERAEQAILEVLESFANAWTQREQEQLTKTLQSVDSSIARCRTESDEEQEEKKRLEAELNGLALQEVADAYTVKRDMSIKIAQAQGRIDAKQIEIEKLLASRKALQTPDDSIRRKQTGSELVYTIYGLLSLGLTMHSDGRDDLAAVVFWIAKEELDRYMDFKQKGTQLYADDAPTRPHSLVVERVRYLPGQDNPHILHQSDPHPCSAQIYNCLGLACAGVGQWCRALNCFSAARTMRFQSINGNGSAERSDIALTLNNIAVCLAEEKRYASSAFFLLAAKELVDCELESSHPRYVTISTNLSKLATRRSWVSPFPPPSSKTPRPSSPAQSGLQNKTVTATEYDALRFFPSVPKQPFVAPSLQKYAVKMSTIQQAIVEGVTSGKKGKKGKKGGKGKSKK